MIKISKISVVIVCILAIICSSCLQKSKNINKGFLPLAIDGIPQIVIVVPEDAPKTVTLARDELLLHLKSLTGASFKVASSIEGHPHAIVLGDNSTLRKMGVQVKSMSRDGYGIWVDKNHIYIAGQDSADEQSTKGFAGWYREKKGAYIVTHHWTFHRGTLYGVYSFLEQLGIRWYFPGKGGTYIPSKPTVKVPFQKTIDKPDYSLRVVGRLNRRIPRKAVVNDKWGWKECDLNEFKDMDMSNFTNWQWLLRMRVSSEGLAYNHRPPRSGFLERFRKTNPEYFALLHTGKRDLKPDPNGFVGCLCYTNEDAYQVMLGDLDAFFSGKHAHSRNIDMNKWYNNANERFPELNGWDRNAFFGDSVSMLPHDSYNPCHCAGCKPYLRLDAPVNAQCSELIWNYIDRVGKWLKKKHPEKFITCLAYGSYSAPPKTLKKLPDNVVVGFCPSYFNKTYHQLDEESYQKMHALADSWSSLKSKPFLLWYHHLYRSNQPNHYGVPMLIPHHLGKFLKDFTKYGDRMYMQADALDLNYEYFNRYVMMKSLYNTDQNVDQLLNEFTRHIYGPSANIIKKLMLEIEQKSITVASSHANQIKIWTEILTPKVIAGYRKQANSAMSIAKESSLFCN